ncbi:unnamed protein product, partial [Rotaria sp. Silwood2]
MWQGLSKLCVVDEEALPQDGIDGLKECESLTSVVETAMSSDVNKSSVSLDPVPQTSLNLTSSDLSLSTALSPKLQVSPRMGRKRRVRRFSKERIEP